MKALLGLAALLSLTACAGWELPVRLECEDPTGPLISVTVTPEGEEPQVVIERTYFQPGDTAEGSALLPHFDMPISVTAHARWLGLEHTLEIPDFMAGPHRGQLRLRFHSRNGPTGLEVEWER